jgi:CBS domain-containing protein
MNVGSVCTKSVISIRGDETVAAAAEKLRRYHVGDLVVIDPAEPRAHPIGVLTDRDIAVSLVATAPDLLQSLRCDEVVRRPVVKVAETDDVFDAVDQMVEAHVRRLPVIDDQGALVGILSLDDLLGLMSRTLLRLTTIPSAQRTDEWSERP